MKVSDVFKWDGESLLYNRDDESELFIYVPEVFFDDTTKNPIARIDGEFVSCLGLLNWCIMHKTGTMTKPKLFNFPTMILFKPYEIIKVKNVSLGDDLFPDDYRIMKFRYGDQVVVQKHLPQLPDNVDLFFKLAVISNKIPKGISYQEGWKIFLENAALNGINYKLSAQLFGILWSVLCRDPEDVSNDFRWSKACDRGEYFSYKPISIKLTPKYVSPYTALISEGFDEGIMAADILSTKSDKDLPNSPLEKIIML